MENRFCPWCGESHPADVVKCPHCGRSLPAKDHLFRRFLIDHTKDKLKGDIEDSLFEAIKNYLLSHLYAMVVGLSVIAVAAIAIFAPSPYDHVTPIDRVEDLRPVAGEPSGDGLTDADRDEIAACLSDYVACLDMAFFQAGTDALNYCISDPLYESLNKDVAEDLLATFYNEFPYIDIDDMPRNFATIHDGTLTAGSDTANGQWLQQNGYEVATLTMTHALYAWNVDPSTPKAQADYVVTMTKENGKWVIVDTVAVAKTEG
ncbi:MAG: zinc ribbon domain-containing protein [Clostridia bacterium]|nr:zinc ribbon domain-containing protein [Clostridia bacterium]